MKKILFAASEAVPFIKTGGLADVVGSLPKYFDKEKYDVRVMLPKYMCMKEEWKEKLSYHTHFYMDLNWRKQYVGILELEYDGITFYFIDNEYYFNGFAPYGDMYADIEKFAFFSKAVLSALPVIGFRPDIIHCHDWQAGLIPVYLDNFRYGDEYYRGIKTIMTIHNLKFQGTWDTKRVRDITGLPQYYFAPDKLEAYKDANYLKGGIVYADRITTVSNSYAEEIKTPFYGETVSYTHLDVYKRQVQARDLKGEDYSVVSVIGDGSLTGGMAYEALNNASSLKTNFIIVLNDNHMSISENVGGMSKYLAELRTADIYTGLKKGVTNALEKVPLVGDSLIEHIRRTKSSIKQLVVPGMFFEDMGITYLGPVPGHNIGLLCKAFKEARKINGPVLLHVMTKKGKGYELSLIHI